MNVFDVQHWGRAMVKAFQPYALNLMQEASDKVKRFSSVVPKTEQNIDVLYNIGMALLGMGKMLGGENILLDNLKRSPHHWQSQVAMGLLCQQRGLSGDALSYLRSALLHCPTNPSLGDMVVKLEQRFSVAQKSQ